MHEAPLVRHTVDLFPHWCKGCFGEVWHVAPGNQRVSCPQHLRSSGLPLNSVESDLFQILWSPGARFTHFRCLDGVWLRLIPDQLEAASAKAQPDQPAFHLVLQAL